MLHDWFTQCIQSPPVTVSVLVPVISVFSYCYIILYYMIIIIILLLLPSLLLCHFVICNFWISVAKVRHDSLLTSSTVSDVNVL